jgi:hypothetical protein
MAIKNAHVMNGLCLAYHKDIWSIHKRIKLENFCHKYYIVKTFGKTYTKAVYLLLKAYIESKE